MTKQTKTQEVTFGKIGAVSEITNHAVLRFGIEIASSVLAAEHARIYHQGQIDLDQGLFSFLRDDDEISVEVAYSCKGHEHLHVGVTLAADQMLDSWMRTLLEAAGLSGKGKN
jgi:hypothetical protein